MTSPISLQLTARHDRGMALVTTLLVLMLISALLVGFTTVVVTDSRYRLIDKNRGQALYGATGGIEKLTVDLGNTFFKNVAPTNAQVVAMTAVTNQPVLSGITFSALNAPQALPGSQLSISDCYTAGGITRQTVTVGANGYSIMYCANTATNNPTTLPDYNIVQQGTYAGLMALKTPYQLDVTAQTATGGEVHLVRIMEAVSIPVFQFGIFSDVDLAFNAAENFGFGGRVHTNGNLFLAEGAGNTLTLSDKVTAYKEVVRQVLSNGNAIANANDTGTVNMTKGGGTYRALGTGEGSVVQGPASAYNEPTWHTISLSTYKGYIENGHGNGQGTGAKQLNLPLFAAGGSNINLIQRPAAADDPTSFVYNERLFNKASIRILLSDTAADITNIPGIDIVGAPQSLEAGAAYGAAPFQPAVAGQNTIPIAASPGAVAGVTTTGIVAGSTTTTINVAALPTAFLTAGTNGTGTSLTITSGANQWTATLCKTKTATTWTGCTITLQAGVGNPGVGSTVSAVVNGVAVSVATVAPAFVVGANQTITVSSTNGFAPNTFWVDDNLASCTGYDTVAVQFTGCTTPAAPANGRTLTTFANVPQNTSVIGGFIKVERLNAANNAWVDITPEILGYGIAGPSQSGKNATCDAAAFDPSPNAIIRLQRVHDSGQSVAGNAEHDNCTPLTGLSKYDYWPMSLYDVREAWPREVQPVGTNIVAGGVMYYVAIDVANLAKWFAGAAPYTVAAGATGSLSKTDNGGFSVYFSDRRNNRNALNQETGEWGWEDFVNPLSATGAPNGLLDAGEDVNGNGVLDTYGGTPNCNGAFNTLASGGVTCVNAGGAITLLTRPNNDIVTAGETFNGIGRAMVNRGFMFRRALKLIHGTSIAPTITGLTVVSENPVYVQGDWNAPGGGFNDPHAATSIAADAVTALSNNWTDQPSFGSNNMYTNVALNSYVASGKPRTPNSYYRVALLAGKGPIFPMPAGAGATFGTDGGAHNFIRFLEGHAANTDTIHYRGSMATFFYNRQANGIFKGNDNFVYGIPVRDYAFDTDFLTPSLLPPLTPMFRDMDAVGFSQQLAPGK